MNRDGESEQRARWSFGKDVMGPIVAQMLWRLYASLDASSARSPRVVLFCARGGLVLRRMLELFARSVALEIRFGREDFMVSRLAAFRTALQRDPMAVAPMVELEFGGRTCLAAARALANVEVNSDPRWQQPFQLSRLLDLLDSTAVGRQVRADCDAQASLLRCHIEALRRDAPVMLCDTGVFGSILRYLQVGVPEVDWRLTVLFRSNYKGIAASHFAATAGVMSESEGYAPWRPATVALLYWPLIESLLEPGLPSVRSYRREIDGRIVSDLEVGGWQMRLEPSPGSMLDGTCEYLRGLTPASISSIEMLGARAWRRLQRRIVFPTRRDVVDLAVGRRGLDFGTDECVVFASQADATGVSWSDSLQTARQSIWPEGELRKQRPRTADVILLGWELSRLGGAIKRATFFPGPSRPAES